MWQTAFAAARAFVKRRLLRDAPELYRQLVVIYSGFPDGTATILSTIFSGLVATLAVLLLRPRVLRTGIKNVIPLSLIHI